MSEPLITIEGVSKKFCRNLKRSLWYGLKDLGREVFGRRHASLTLQKDEFWAVKDVSFELKRGECLGLIGHNGAGKTTLLRMLNGLIKPDQGRIEMRGRVGALIALGAGFNPVLTGRENIYVNASVLGLNKREIDAKLEEIIDFAELGEFIDSPVQSYSSGMQVRLGFAVATALEPDILLLDEVLSVGDAAFRVKCFNRIQEILGRCAVVFVSHSMPQVTRVSSRLLMLEKGHAIAAGEDIGGIIARYHSQINFAPEQAPQGTGRSLIEAVAILDNGGSPCEHLKYGTPFSLAVRYRHQEPATAVGPRLLITIADSTGSNIAQIEETLPEVTADRPQLATLHFDSLQLNCGKYFFTVSILLGPYGELSCVRRNVAAINVENSYVGYAPVIFASRRVDNETLF